MEATLNEKAEKIKKTINGTAEKSKEAIREFIDANNKHVDAAMTANTKMLNTITESLNHQAIDETVTSDIAISNFKVVNYELSLSISLNYENFEIKPAYHFAFPEISEGEESIKPFSYFTISFTYTGFTGSKKIRSLFKQLRKL